MQDRPASKFEAAVQTTNFKLPVGFQSSQFNLPVVLIAVVRTHRWSTSSKTMQKMLYTMMF